MTPEERAANIEWPDDLISMSKETGDALVAAAIRAAENDALDRAADAVPPPCCDSFISCAEFIRTLKHH